MKFLKLFRCYHHWLSRSLTGQDLSHLIRFQHDILIRGKPAGDFDFILEGNDPGYLVIHNPDQEYGSPDSDDGSIGSHRELFLSKTHKIVGVNFYLTPEQAQSR